MREQKNFDLTPGTDGPTLRQKVRFILSSREQPENAMATPLDTIERIETSVGSLARSVYTRSSISTHVATTRKELIQLQRYVDAVLSEILEID